MLLLGLVVRALERRSKGRSAAAATDSPAGCLFLPTVVVDALQEVTLSEAAA